MKSFKMKALALATLGLGGLVMAGSAFAACPDPTAFSNQGYATPNGPWSAETVSSATIAAASPGLDGTNCAMSVALSASPSSIAKAFVTDNSPQNEPRYRVRFYVDLSQLSASFAAGNAVRLLTASSTSGPPGGVSTAMVTVILGGPASAPFFRFQVADPGQASNFKTVTVTAPNPTGVNRVEFDYNTSTGSACAAGNANGSFCTWVTSGSAASGADSAPTTTYNLLANAFGTSGNTWSGVKSTNFGIFASNASYRASAPTQVVTLDEFDSRRQTFIGQ